jgi:hypothetical protein
VSADVDELVRCARRLVANPEEARRRGLAAREAALERYGLGRFLDHWDDVLADLRAHPTLTGRRHTYTTRLDEQILIPARERNIP